MSAIGLCPMCPPSTRTMRLIGGLCSWHYANPCPIPEIPVLSDSKPNTPIKLEPLIQVASKKRSAENRTYLLLRKKYLELNPYCAAKLEGCGVRASEIHHRAGRIGKLLTDSTRFLPVCHSCHQYITENSEEAIERGFSLKRNQP